MNKTDQPPSSLDEIAEKATDDYFVVCEQVGSSTARYRLQPIILTACQQASRVAKKANCATRKELAKAQATISRQHKALKGIGQRSCIEGIELDDLQAQLAEANTTIERLESDVENWKHTARHDSENCGFIAERAKKAEAEVERLTEERDQWKNAFHLERAKRAE